MPGCQSVDLDLSFVDAADLPPLGRIAFDRRAREEVDFVFSEIFVDGAYMRHGITLQPGATVIDAGANIGLFSLFAARACGGELTLFAFEPAPSIHRYLVENLRHHGLFQRPGIHLFPLGLGRMGGPARATFTVYPALPANSTLYASEKADELARCKELRLASWKEANPGASSISAEQLERELDELVRGEELTIELVPLADVLRGHGVTRVDLLKIDTEGAELDVLDGLDDATWPLVQQVVLEASNEARAAELERRLRSAGFSRVVVERPHWASDPGVDNREIYALR